MPPKDEPQHRFARQQEALRLAHEARQERQRAEAAERDIRLGTHDDRGFTVLKDGRFERVRAEDAFRKRREMISNESERNEAARRDEELAMREAVRLGKPDDSQVSKRLAPFTAPSRRANIFAPPNYGPPLFATAKKPSFGKRLFLCAAVISLCGIVWYGLAHRGPRLPDMIPSGTVLVNTKQANRFFITKDGMILDFGGTKNSGGWHRIYEQLPDKSRVVCGKPAGSFFITLDLQDPTDGLKIEIRKYGESAKAVFGRIKSGRAGKTITTGAGEVELRPVPVR